ncbi:MAG TPA: FtsH protease activity modulator HflK [Vitreimonas sp.]|uniref:FtsH protease activity modulator HflK n=1 Tax=Vitreimonas sp. TaxID=3069702 RepID=UPI002D3B51C3|nr:FtsH protease activity modulator HflK [Vitreimonas sp.]HYD89361.1 FtsH protease activity modulator HflK [Vitreimonas sp.]
MPWNDQSGGGQQGGGQGPWGGGPRRPWGQPPKSPQRPQGGDLEDWLRQMRERFNMRGGNGGGERPSGGRGLSWRLIVGIVIVGWLLSGVYQVDEGEQAVITRLGDYNRTSGPGIHWHLPAPIEAQRTINVTGQRTETIGFEEGNNREIRDIPDESLMITGDRNIVQIQFRIYYNIKDAVAYAFNVREPDLAVRQVAESAMREVIGRRLLEPIITTERGAVEQGVEELMQATLDEYESGVQVLQVELLPAAAPPAVIEAFNDVVIAGQEASTRVNEAERDTARIVNEAQAYRERVVREATGEAGRFIAVHAEYRRAPQVTRDRLYLETMERVYQRGNLVILDQRGGAVPYLPLDGMVRRPATTAQPQGDR